MPSLNQSLLVAYSAEQMYRLVNDYEAYPQFISGCVGAKTLVQGQDELEAELHIQKLGISQRFTTHNTMIANREIKMELVRGPFKNLSGSWRFEPFDEQTCRISLQLDFEFESPMVALVFGKIFNELIQKMIQAFKQRAKEVYGG
ncbi:ubiquinone-binding protein [Pasteurellaceae bacterium RH1A]|nr:ubiquinone-binding protein [Pasteurellaceae bacterium RH1A]